MPTLAALRAGTGQGSGALRAGTGHGVGSLPCANGAMLSHPPYSARPWTICSAAAALVYGVHPLRVEVLCWPSCQPYLLATMWSLLSIMAHHRALRATDSDDMQRKAAASPSAVGTGRSPGARGIRCAGAPLYWRCVSVLCYAAAALSKAAAIPVVTLLLARMRCTGFALRHQLRLSVMVLGGCWRRLAATATAWRSFSR